MTGDDVAAWVRQQRRGNACTSPAVIHVTDQTFDGLARYAADHADDLGCGLTSLWGRLTFDRRLVMPAPPGDDETREGGR